MSSWKDFVQSEPEMAQFGKNRFLKEVAYLGTIRKNGYPRVHPVTPILSPDNLFLFMEPTSPKGKDLIRNGLYSLHSLIIKPSGEEGEFWIRGTAQKIENEKLRSEAIENATYNPADRYILFQLLIEEAGGTVYENGTPNFKRWKPN